VEIAILSKFLRHKINLRRLDFKLQWQWVLGLNWRNTTLSQEDVQFFAQHIPADLTALRLGFTVPNMGSQLFMSLWSRFTRIEFAYIIATFSPKENITVDDVVAQGSKHLRLIDLNGRMRHAE